MKIDAGLSHLVTFEVYHAALNARISDRAKAMPNVSAVDFAKLSKGLGSVEKAERFVAAMPDKPAIGDLLTAFGTPEKLGDFVDKTMGGNLGALAALADKGCKRDAAALAALAAEFEAAPDALKDVLESGGIGAHPEALAEIFATGCEGKPDEMAKFCKTFDDPTKREKLRTALDEGGLGQAPAALGELAKGDEGKLLLKVATDADQAALKDMLLSGGMGGHPPDHPETLKSVLTEALGGDPKRLKQLHDAFPHKDGKMPEMQSLMHAMNGKSVPDAATPGRMEVKAGKRLKSLMDAFKDRDSSLTNAQQAQKLYDPFFKSIDKDATGRCGSDETGASTLKGAGGLITARANPPAGQLVATMTGALPPGGAQALLIDLTPDADNRDALTDAVARVAAAGVTVTALKADTEDRDADPEASKASQEALDAADKLRIALDKKLDGGTPAEVAALTKSADTCFACARDEPGASLRADVVDAGERAMASAQAALARQAGVKLGTLAGATEQQGALAAAGDAATRVEADPKATESEKTAAKAVALAATQGMTATALANQMTDASAQSAAARAAQATLLGKPDTSAEVATALAAKKKEAEDATHATASLIKAIKAAEPPIDTALLAEAAAIAETVVRAGLATADETVMANALAAGKALSDEIAKRCKELAAATEMSLAFALPEAKAGVLAVNDIGALEAALEREHADADPLQRPAIEVRQKAMREAALEANRSALASADLARLTGISDLDHETAAKEAAKRQAGIDGTTVDVAEANANDAAKLAGEAAKKAADDLGGKVAPIDVALIKAASDAAEAAARVAVGATDKTQRDLALTQGKRAADAAIKALAANAQHALTAQVAARKQDAKNNTNAVRGPADTFTGPPIGTNKAAVKAALDEAMGSIAEAAAAELAEFAISDATVQDARAKAAAATAQAGRPGAGYLTKLKAIAADAEAQKALATLAKTKADTKVTGIPTVPAPPWPPGGPPYAQLAAPTAPTETTLRDASVLCEAAINASIKWVTAAETYVNAAREYQRLAELVPDPTRTAEEKNDLVEIKKAYNEGKTDAGAPKMKQDASAALVGLNTTTTSLADKSKALMAAIQISRIKFNPPGNSHASADTALDPADAALENAAGFASLIGTKAFKTVKMPDNSMSTTPPSTRDDLLATGANLNKKALPVTVGAAMPINGHPNCKMDLEHMCERHCRDHFTFGPGELMAEEDVMMSDFLKTRTGGLARGPATDARSTLYSNDEKAVRNLGTGKTTTMWPEGITPAQIQAAAALALANMKTDNTTGQPFQHFVFSTPDKQYSKIIPNIAVGHLTLKVALGVSADGPANTDAVKVQMFYPVGAESLTVSDCHVARKALGIP